MSRIPAPFTTFADVCERAHPTDGNARTLLRMARSEDDVNDLVVRAQAFSAEARAALGEVLIDDYLAAGLTGRARMIATDPVFRDIIGDDYLRRAGARDELAHRRRKRWASAPVDVDTDATWMDDMDAEHDARHDAVGGAR
jgi:hypothetical protein